MKKSTVFIFIFSAISGACASLLLDGTEFWPYFAGLMVGSVAMGGAHLIDAMEESS